MDSMARLMMSRSGLLRSDTSLDCVSVLLLNIGQASGRLVQARMLVLVQGGQSYVTGLGIIAGVGHVGRLFEAASLILVQGSQSHIASLGIVSSIVSRHVVRGLALARGNAVDDSGSVGVSRSRHDEDGMERKK